MITSWPWYSSGTNGIGGQGITLAIVESPSGAARPRRMNPATVAGVAGRTSIPPDDLADRLEPELEPRRDAEVAAAAADRPEQVGLVRRRRRRSTSPSAVTISAASRLSIVRPCLRTR